MITDVRGGVIVKIFEWLKNIIFFAHSIELLGVLNSSTTYYFDLNNKQILREDATGKTIIDELFFFMEIDDHVKFTGVEYVFDKDAKDIAEKYLYLKNGKQMEYERAVLAFECSNQRFKIVIHFDQLLLRWYGGYREENRQKEVVVLVEQLPDGFTKWDLKEYEEVIRNQLKRKGLVENAFDSFLEAITLPEHIRDLNFSIELVKGGRPFGDNCRLERFVLYKETDGHVWISWSVGFGFGGYTPGAGRSDPVPAMCFEASKVRLANYIASKYSSLCGIKSSDVLSNPEIDVLFYLIHGTEE